MKTITAKDFRTHQTAVLKDVRAGQAYLLTSHRAPVARLMPIKKTTAAAKPPRGSYAAIVASLKYTSSAEGELKNLSYKELRAKMMQEKYGDGQVYKPR